MTNDTVDEVITSHLLDYGDENGFRPLIARDYGSRVRGIADSSSDYDVFFVFAQPPADYATGSATETYEKTIPPEESSLDTEIELHGWNLRKFIGNDGLAGSNPTAIEFCASKEQYFQIEDRNVLDPLYDILTHAQSDFKPYALINHYRSLAAGHYGKYIEGDYKIASDASYHELINYIDPPWGRIAEDAAEHLSIDESETEIGTQSIDVHGTIEWTLFMGDIDVDDALDYGLVEPTTTDGTVKRHLNIEQALMRARYIEEHHTVPPMDVTQLLRDVAGAEWLPEHIYAEIGGQISKKKAGDGEKTIEYSEAIHDWIEDELDRDVDPDGHVDRTPDVQLIDRRARALYDAIDWGDR